MNLPDFTDSVIDRKLTFQLAQKGCGLHHERYLCFFDQEQNESLSSVANELFLELGKIHYEADFCAGTMAEENISQRSTADDNCYFVDSLSEELAAFLRFKSRITVTESMIESDGVEAVKNAVVEAMKRDRFKRDETTKVAYFKINHSKPAQ